MGRIIAIGGGELRSGDTLGIDKIIVDAANKDIPKLLFIPTASNDAEGYIDGIKAAFGDGLGCVVTALRLVESPPSNSEIRELIVSADIIYVGGGNTKMMMEVWRQHSVDNYLKEAYEKGVILSGLSAGSICWFEYGHSDSDTLASGEIQPYSLVEGMGLIPIINCPHYNEEGRADDFSVKVMESRVIGLALDNYTAIDIKDDGFRIVKTDKYAHAYRIVPSNQGVSVEVIEESREFEDIGKLFSAMSAS